MGQFKLKPVERVKSISKNDFIEHYYKQQRPVLIEHLIDDWPAKQKWNLDYIQSLAEDKVVPLYDSKPTKGNQKSAEPAKFMKLYDYIELIKKGPTELRIFFFDIMKKMPLLLNDFSYPDIGLKFFKRLPVLFFGSTNSKVLAHYDMDLADLLHFHFHGQKSITLFPPDQTKYLYKVPYSVHNLECIDMSNPDFEKYPALKYAEGYYTEMKHGEALYMPSGYWHYVEYFNGGFSMTLRAFTKKPKIALRMLYNVALMRNFENIMRSIRGQRWIDYKEALAIKKTNKTVNR